MKIDDARQLQSSTDASGGAAATVPSDIYFTRQPILDRECMLCGFQLVPRIVGEPDRAGQHEADEAGDDTDDEAQNGPQRGDDADSVRALIDALLKSDVLNAMVGHRASLGATRELLFNDAVVRIPSARVTLNLSPDMEIDDTLIARLIALHRGRYRFVLDHVIRIDDGFAKLLPYAESVKIGFRGIERTLLPKLAGVLKSAGKILIAEGIDSQVDFELARDLGFDRFQGYFFALKQTGTRHASAPRQALLDLLQLLASEPTVAQLEVQLKLTPVLVMHLLRIASSGSHGGGNKIATLRDAINAIGTNRIARWTQLLLYADGRKVALEDDPLLQLAATRARFMELAVERLPEAGFEEVDGAFLAGGFSLVDAVFGGTCESALDMLTLSRTIRAAIVAREGMLGQLLNAVEALERADWARLDEVCGQLAPLTSAEVAALGLTAAGWAGRAGHDAQAEGLERLDD